MYLVDIERNSKISEVGRIPSIKKLAVNMSLKEILKDKYPDDWKEIVKCVEDAVAAGHEGDALEAQIDVCLQGITAVAPEDRDAIKKIPRSFIHVGGG